MRVAIFWMRTEGGWQPIEIIPEREGGRVRLYEWRHILSASNTDVAETVADIEPPKGEKE